MAGAIDRFDKGSRLALALAQSEAARLHHARIGPAHLLLGLLREGGGAAQILTSAGVDGRRLHQAVAQVMPSGSPHEESTQLALSPETERVIALAPEEANQLGASYIATEHLLLGLLREPGNAGSILSEIGVSIDRIREKVGPGLRRP